MRGQHSNYDIKDMKNLTFTIFAVFVFNICFSQNSSLVLYLPLNGETTDFSSYHDSIIADNLIYGTDRFNLSNRAGYFNGFTDFIQIQDSPVLNFSDSIDYSISLWVKCSDQNYPDYWFMPLIQKRYDLPYPQGYGFGFLYNKTSGEIATSWGNLTGDNGGLIGSSEITDGNWHFLVMVITREAQNEERKIY